MSSRGNGSDKGSRKDSFEPTPEEMEKIREARKMLQAHNPNYLKSTSSSKNGEMKDYDNIDEIPIAELNLDVPLKIHSKTKRSEKYLEEKRKTKDREDKHSKKSKRKSKKSKKPEINSASDSDEPKSVHVVNKAMELPEGASLSDNDGKNELNLNDPHRALDINLEDEFNTMQSSSSIQKVSADLSKTEGKSHRKKKEADELVNIIDNSEKKKKDKKHKNKRKKEAKDLNLLEATAPLDLKVKNSKAKGEKN